MSEPELRYPPSYAPAYNASNVTQSGGSTETEEAISTIIYSQEPYGNGTYVASSSSKFSGSARFWPSVGLENNSDGFITGQHYNSNGTYGYLSRNIITTSDYGTIAGEWYQLEFPKRTMIDHFTWFTRNSSTSWSYPFTLSIVGSNDGTSWTLLKEYTTDILSDTGANPERQITHSSGTVNFTISNSYYKYYRLVFKSLVYRGARYAAFSKLILYGKSDTLGLQYPPRALTSETTTIEGEAYGNGVYRVSASSEEGFFLSHKAFDYSVSAWSSNIRFPSGGGTVTTGLNINGIYGEWVTIELPEPIQINNYRIKPRNTNNIERFIIFGSNDASTYTQIDNNASTDQNINSDTYYTYSVTTPDYYKYYTCLITKTSGSDGRFAQIIELQLFGLPSTDKLYRFPPRALTEGASGQPPVEVIESGDKLEGQFNMFNQSYGNGLYKTYASSINGTSYGSFARVFTDTINNYTSASYPSVNRLVGGVGNYNSFNHTNFIVPEYKGDWVKIELPAPIYVNKIVMVNGNAVFARPAHYNIYGSNNGYSWDTIYSQAYPIGSAPVTQECILHTKQSYKWFGLTVNKVNGAVGYFWISSFDIYGTPESSSLIQSDNNSQILQLAPQPSGKVVIGKEGAESTKNEPVLEVNGEVHLNGMFVGNVGIGATTPATRLHVVNESSSTGGGDSILNGSTEAICRFDGSANTILIGEVNNSIQFNAFSKNSFGVNKNIVLNAGGGNVGIGTSSPGAKLAVNGDIKATGDICDNTIITFTGQHRCYPGDSIQFSQVDSLTGLIVSSNGEYMTLNTETPQRGKDGITISESVPMIDLTQTTKEKKVFGVIANVEDPGSRQDQYGLFTSIVSSPNKDRRIFVNSVGEGAIWVTDINGVFENGDYITSSIIPGYGQKQDDDLMHNYTVAKITMDCDFTQPTKEKIQPKTTIIEYEVEEDMRDASGNLVYETVQVLDDSGNPVMEQVPKLDASGNPEYETLTLLDESGNPLTELVQVLDDSGNPVTEQVPQVDASGNPLTEMVQVLDGSGNPVTEQVPQVDASGNPLMEMVEVLDASGNALMEEVPLTEEVPLMEEVALIEEVPLMEEVEQTLTQQVMVDQIKTVERVRRVMVTKTREETELDDNGKMIWVPVLDASGNPVMEPAYEMRYLLIDGTEITKEEYEQGSGMKYRSAFVGCTYHCG